MRSAAGTAVISRDHDDPDRSQDLYLAAVFHPVQLAADRVYRLNFQVFPHCPVSFEFYIRKFFRSDLSVEIHCAVFAPEMESHLPVSEPAVD